MSLKRKVISGLLWTGSSRFVGQLLTWAITITVMRLLSPEDYGLLAMAMVSVSFLVLVAEGGLGAAVVQARDLDGHALRSVFAAAILVNVAAFAFLFCVAPLIADFFGEERVVLIVRVLSLQFLVGIFAIVPNALLARRMEFKHPAMVVLASSILGSLTTLGLAFAGYGVWALVAGNLVAHACQTLGVNILSPFLHWPDFALRGAYGLLRFGGQVTAARALWLVYSQSDILIAGKLLGKEALGFYSVTMHLASLPVQKASAVINHIALPAFASTQHDHRLIADSLLKALRAVSFVAFPALWGISAIAPEIVTVLLGPRWEPAIVPLQLLPLVMPLSMAGTILNTAFQGIGCSGVVVRNVITACLIMPAAFWLGSHWGLVGLSLAWLLGFPLVLMLNLRRMLPLIGLEWRKVFSAIGPIVLVTAAMYVAVTIARAATAQTLGAAGLMAMLIGVGAVTYGTLMWITDRETVHGFAGPLGLHREKT